MRLYSITSVSFFFSSHFAGKWLSSPNIDSDNGTGNNAAAYKGNNDHVIKNIISDNRGNVNAGNISGRHNIQSHHGPYDSDSNNIDNAEDTGDGDYIDNYI